MPLIHKSFVKVCTFGILDDTQRENLIIKAFEKIDEEVREFLKSQHWSQSRDSFQTVTAHDNLLVVCRTLVYTSEQLAFTPQDRPPTQ